MKFRLRKNPPGMDCNELVELVTDYLEGKLPPADVERFAAHLEECEACANGTCGDPDHMDDASLEEMAGNY